MKLLVITVIGAFAFCGCSVFGPATPTTTLKVQVSGQSFAWECPKQVEAEGLEFIVNTNGTGTIKVSKVRSTNDPLVIDKSYAGQIGLVKQWGDTGTQLVNAGASLAMKAAAQQTNSPIVVTNLPSTPPIK